MSRPTFLDMNWRSHNTTGRSTQVKYYGNVATLSYVPALILFFFYFSCRRYIINRRYSTRTLKTFNSKLAKDHLQRKTKQKLLGWYN